MSAVKSATATDTSALNLNAYRSENGRDVYNLFHLLRDIPNQLGTSVPVTPDLANMAEAARQMAENGSSTILHGLESLGTLLFMAVNNRDYELRKMDISNLGGLINHLAVEAQFMSETQSGFAFILHERDAEAREENAIAKASKKGCAA